MPKPYWTVVIPWVPPQFRTEWHPTEEFGPFSSLTRGVFYDRRHAIAWGSEHLNGTPYSIHYVDPAAEKFEE